MSRLLVRGIGTILTGLVERPVADGDAILVEDDVVSAIGREGDLAATAVDTLVDAGGATVIPGLFDSHCHPTLGDYSPRQRTQDWIESAVHGGVTSFVSAGEVHVPGRPKGRTGTKALAILAAEAWRTVRPAGAKVLGGAVLLEPGLTEGDFAEMAESGVGLIGEIGVGSVWQPELAGPMVSWGHAHGMRAIMHMGGASVPGSSVIDAEIALAVGPDVAGHANGGPTAPALDDVRRLLSESAMAIEIVHCGNVRAASDIARLLMDAGALDRLIVGTDNPSGTGINPLGILRVLSWLCSLAGVDPATAIACATGNSARTFGLATGVLEPGRPADLVVLDAPRGSQASTALEALGIGDTPSVAVVIIDGQVRVHGSRNTPPAARRVTIDGHGPAGH